MRNSVSGGILCVVFLGELWAVRWCGVSFRCSPSAWSVVSSGMLGGTGCGLNKLRVWVLQGMVLCRFCLVYGVVVLSSVSLMISSMGFGAGVVAMVQPIHAPMARIAMKPMRTGVAISQNCTFALAPRFSHG